MNAVQADKKINGYTLKTVPYLSQHVCHTPKQN